MLIIIYASSKISYVYILYRGDEHQKQQKKKIKRKLQKIKIKICTYINFIQVTHVTTFLNDIKFSTICHLSKLKKKKNYIYTLFCMLRCLFFVLCMFLFCFQFLALPTVFFFFISIYPFSETKSFYSHFFFIDPIMFMMMIKSVYKIVLSTVYWLC